MPPDIVFDDGTAYERFMGAWSRRAGRVFLEWLAPAPGLRWLDVGCGSGAFTELVLTECAPAAIDGIDPSEAQLEYARARPGTRLAHFQCGDAMALLFAADAFDVAVMPLVVFFVPDPARGVAEMARVVRPGGTVAAYAWDLLPGGGFPYEAAHAELRASGVEVPSPPSPDASRLDVLPALWAGAGLEAVETSVVTVRRTFVDFADYWATLRHGPSVARALAAMATAARDALAVRLQARLPAPDAAGQLTLSATAHAVRGRVPG